MVTEDKKVFQPIVIILLLTSSLCSCASRKPNIDHWKGGGTVRLGSQGKKLGFMKMSSEIQSLLGSPYRWGGTSPEGLDCSGLVCLVYQRSFGLKLPKSCEELYGLGKPVDKKELAYGDLVFFATSGSGVSHVGIYLGSGEFVHVSKSLGTIISNLRERYYLKRYKGGRRLID